MKIPKKVYQRLGIDLPVALHKDLKEMAAKRNVRMTSYVMRLIIAALKQEHKFD